MAATPPAADKIVISNAKAAVLVFVLIVWRCQLHSHWEPCFALRAVFR